MPYTKQQQRPHMDAPLEARDIELHHLGRHRPGAVSRSSSEEAMPRVAVRPALYVTSSPDKFWRTKRGIALSCLVVLALLGGIVGGVIGAEKGNNDTSRRNFGLPTSTTPTLAPTPTLTPTPTPSTTATHSHAPTSAHATSSSAAATETETKTVTEIIPRTVPRRYLQPLVADATPLATH